MATTANTHPLGITGFALVTGGGSGIGRATCLLLAREGCAGICVADISSKAASTVVAELQQVASNPSFKATQYALDVVDAKSVQMMITKVVEEFGRVDYAVNCAGIGAIKHGLAETEQDEWDRMIAVNLTGVFACVKEEIQQMMKQEPFQTRYILIIPITHVPDPSRSLYETGNVQLITALSAPTLRSNVGPSSTSHLSLASLACVIPAPTQQQNTEWWVLHKRPPLTIPR